MSDDNYLTTSELNDIAAIVEGVNEIDACIADVCFDDIPIFDSNGCKVGTVSMSDFGEFVFYPLDNAPARV